MKRIKFEAGSSLQLASLAHHAWRKFRSKRRRRTSAERPQTDESFDRIHKFLRLLELLKTSPKDVLRSSYSRFYNKPRLEIRGTSKRRTPDVWWKMWWDLKEKLNISTPYSTHTSPCS